MKIGILAPALLGAALALSADTAPAQQQTQDCGRRAGMLKLLADKYRETRVASGIANSGALVELLASEGGATWTLVVTSPQGVTCLVAAGEAWRAKSDAERGTAL